MRRTILFIFVLILFIYSLNAPEGNTHDYYTLTNCADSDGDRPSVLGGLSYNFTSNINLTDERGYKTDNVVKGWGNQGDDCAFGFWYTLTYAGYKFHSKENVLIENVCPSTNLIADSPGALQEQTKKFYKCKCKEIEGAEGKVEGTKAIIGGVCTNTPEEIPAKLAYDSYIKWEQDGRPNPSFITRIIKAFGWYG